MRGIVLPHAVGFSVPAALPTDATPRRGRESRGRRPALARALLERLPDPALAAIAATRPARRHLLRTLADTLGDGRLGVEPATVRLRLSAGERVFAYRLQLGPGAVRVRADRPGAVGLELELGLLDAVHIGLGRLDAGSALLERRLEVSGDAALAFRLTDAF